MRSPNRRGPLLASFLRTPAQRRYAILIGGGLIGLIASIFLIGIGTYYYLAPSLPDVATLRDIRMQVPLRIYSRDGRLLAQIGDQRRTPVRYEDIPRSMVNAFLAAEDDRFFSHGASIASGWYGQLWSQRSRERPVRGAALSRCSWHGMYS